MKFLPFVLIWLVRSASGQDKLKSCINTSGNKGVCLSEILCLGMGGLNIGMCSSSTAEAICCKTSFVIDNEIKNASSVTSLNTFLIYKESKTNCTFSMRNSVPLDLFHDPQNTVHIESARKLLDIFERNYPSEHSQKCLTYKHPQNIHRNNSSEKLLLPVKLDPKLENNSSLLSKQHLLNYIKKDPPRISSTEDLPRNQKLNERNLEHNPQKLINWKDLSVNKSQVKQKFHDPRNPVKMHATNYLQKPVQTIPTFYMQKSVHIKYSQNLQKQILATSESNHRKIVKGTTTRNPEWRKMPRVEQNLQNPVQIKPTDDLRKPVPTVLTFYPQNPMQVLPTHDIHQVVKVLDSPDRQSSIMGKTNHDLRNPIKERITNNLRKPVQIDSTFYLQKPVQVHSSHNQRKPVKVADSHDLRWPVVQEPDHDLRNPVIDVDFFRSENEETKLDKIIQDYAKKMRKDDIKEGSNDPVYELLHEDDRIKTKCAHEIRSWNDSTSDNRKGFENRDKAFQQKVSFRNSTKACGIPFNESTKNLYFNGKKLNVGPWMVSVQEYFFGKFRHKCGGSLLNNLWVITAAHCVDLRPKWDFLLKFRTENNKESQSFIERLVNKISIHPKYNNMNFDNDIALLRMELPVTFQPNIVPICLPESGESIEKRKAVIFGWKVATRRDESSGEAQAETVPVLTNEECEVMFSETGVNESIEKNFVCAGARSVKESCTGDSGGPMAILDTTGRWSLAGLYSWGKTCKIPNQPEVYISVKSYVNWIEDTIACFEHYINLGKVDG